MRFFLLLLIFISCSNLEKNSIVTTVNGYRINVITTNPEGCNYTSVYIKCQIQNNTNRSIIIGDLKNKVICFKEREKADAVLVNRKDTLELKILKLPKIIEGQTKVDFECYLKGFEINGDFEFIKNKIENEVLNGLKYVKPIIPIDGKRLKFYKKAEFIISYQLNENQPSLNMVDINNINNTFSKRQRTKIKFIQQ